MLSSFADDMGLRGTLLYYRILTAHATRIVESVFFNVLLWIKMRGLLQISKENGPEGYRGSKSTKY